MTILMLILSNLLIIGGTQFFPSVPVILEMFAESVVRLIVLTNRLCKMRRHLEHEIPDFQTHLFYVSKNEQMWHCLSAIH